MTTQNIKKPKTGRTSPMFYNKEQPLRDIFAAPYLPVVQKNGSVLMEFTYEEPRSTVTFRSVNQPTQQQRKLLLNLVNVWWSNLNGEFTGTRRQDGSCPEDTFKLHIDKLMDDCGLSGTRTEDREKVLTDLSALNLMQIDWLDRIAGARTIMSLVRRIKYDYVTGYLDVSFEPDFFDKLLGFDTAYIKRFISLDVVNGLGKDTRAAALFLLLQTKGRGRQASGNYGVVYTVTRKQIIEHLSLEAMEERSIATVISRAFKAIKNHTGLEYSYDRSIGTYKITDSSKKMRDIPKCKSQHAIEGAAGITAGPETSTNVQDDRSGVRTYADVRQEIKMRLLQGGFPPSIMNEDIIDDVLEGRRDHRGHIVINDPVWDDFDDLMPTEPKTKGIVTVQDVMFADEDDF